MYFESRRSSNSIHRSDQSERFEMGLSSRTFQSLMRSFSLVQSSDCRRCLGCCMKKRTSSCSNACKRKVLIGSFVAVVVGRSRCCGFRYCILQPSCSFSQQRKSSMKVSLVVTFATSKCSLKKTFESVKMKSDKSFSLQFDGNFTLAHVTLSKLKCFPNCLLPSSSALL